MKVTPTAGQQPICAKKRALPSEMVVPERLRPEPASRRRRIGRITAGDGLVAHVPGRRRRGSHEGEMTPAPGDLIARDFTAERPDEKRLTDITETKAADGKVHPSPVIDRHDGKTVAYTAGHGPDAQPADTMPGKAAATLPESARPPAHSDRGRHHRRPGRPEPIAVRADRIDGREGPFAG